MAWHQTGAKPLSGTMMAYFILNTAMENNTPNNIERVNVAMENNIQVE